MSEFIIEMYDDYEKYVLEYGCKPTYMHGFPLREEIIRCRDCEFLYTGGYCTLLEFWHGDISDKFCAWGERRQP